MKNSDQALTHALRQALGAAKPQSKASNTHAYAAQKQATRQQGAARRKK